MGILDTAIHVGVESTYGTPASLTRSFEGKADTFKRENERIKSVGFRSGMEGIRSDRVVTVNMGGAGSLELDVLTKGFGMLLKSLLGGAVAPTQQGVTTAYIQTYTSTADGPSQSLTIQTVRSEVGGTTQQFTHHGCVVTGWTLENSPGGLLTLNLDFDFEDVDTSTAAGTPTYPASTVPFDWTQAAITLNATPLHALEFSLQADLGLKTDRRYLRGSALKKQPVRAAVPTYTGNLVVDFEDDSRYAEFAAGTVVGPLVATWTGAVIDAPHAYEVEVTIPALQWTGESPEASLDDLTSQPLPFEVLDNGTDPMVTITYQSTDTAI